MLLKLYCSSVFIPSSDFANEGFKEVMYLLWFLQKRGVDYEIVDTSTLTDHELEQMYAEVISLSVSKKFSIRRAFGTKRRSGFKFGREVPALFVYQDINQPPIDVYPRIEGLPWNSVTILEFLKRLLREVNA